MGGLAFTSLGYGQQGLCPALVASAGVVMPPPLNTTSITLLSKIVNSLLSITVSVGSGRNGAAVITAAIHRYIAMTKFL